MMSEELQSNIALLIVASTALIFMIRAAKQKSKGGCGSGSCGCGSSNAVSDKNPVKQPDQTEHLS